MENYLAHLKCSICLQLYEDAQKLLCGHSFCKGCIEKNIKCKDKVFCSACLTETSYEELTPDIRINEFVSFFKSIESVENSALENCSWCDVHMDTRDVHFCKECKDVLCFDCYLKHGKSRKSNSHTSYALSSSPLPYCQLHSEKLKYYCTEPICKILICVSCAVTSHHSHCKQTIEERIDPLKEEIADRILSAHFMIDKLISHKRYAKNYKQKIEELFEELDLEAKKRRDFIVKQACEAYDRNSSLLSQEKRNVMEKMNENIKKIDACERNMSALLKYTQEYLNNKSIYDIYEISEEIKKVSRTEYETIFEFVKVAELELIPQLFRENNIEQNLKEWIGNFSLQVKEEKYTIASSETSNLFYENIVQPQLISCKCYIDSQSFTYDVVYAERSNVIYSLKLGEHCPNKCFLYLVKSSEIEQNTYFRIEGCFYDEGRSYLAMLPNNNILVLCLFRDGGVDKLIEVDSNLTSSKEFPISFCNVHMLNGICSSPCNMFVILVSTKLLKVYKYSVVSKHHEIAEFPENWRDTHFSCMSLSRNNDHIAFLWDYGILLFSFENQAILSSIGSTRCAYSSVSFLTERFVMIGMIDCSLNVFDVASGNLLRKINKVKGKDNKDYKIKALPIFVKACSGSIVVFDQNVDIVKVFLKSLY